MKYLPFLNGIYSTSPGLLSMTKANGADQFIFQIDSTYGHYMSNKKKCRQENIRKYYCESSVQLHTMRVVNRYITERLVKEYPSQFTNEVSKDQFKLANKMNNESLVWNLDWNAIEDEQYASLFDGLSCQVQEDLAIFQLDKNGNNYLSAIHLCSPNHWAPGDKIGKSFDAIHTPVPGMERTLLNYGKMLTSIVNSPVPFTRFAWGLATDSRLNHHPVPPPGVNSESWHGRTSEKDATWYVRSERQNLIGFPEANAFLFTIRTYFYAVSELEKNEKSMLASALKSMTQETLQYKGLAGSLESLLATIGDS